jgi:hypothetical protein
VELSEICDCADGATIDVGFRGGKPVGLDVLCSGYDAFSLMAVNVEFGSEDNLDMMTTENVEERQSPSAGASY